MEVLTLILTGAALLVSIGAAISAHRSADAARKTADIDFKRRHDEETPTVTANYVSRLSEAPAEGRVTRSYVVGVELVIDGPRDAYNVTVELLPNLNAGRRNLRGFWTGPGSNGDETRVDVGLVSRGHAPFVQATTANKYSGGPARLLVTMVDDAGASWDVLAEVQCPPKPLVTFR